MIRQPHIWWQSFACKRPLAKVVIALLQIPASAAIVEQCNKACSLQKTKLQNRQTADRGGKLAIVAYNVKDDKENVDGDGASGCTAPFQKHSQVIDNLPSIHDQKR